MSAVIYKMVEIMQERGEWPDEEPAKKFKLEHLLTTGADILEMNQEIKYVADGLIPENAITLFSAKGGSGKSTVVTQLGAAVSEGKPIFGLRTSKRLVAIIDHENPLPVLKKRVAAIPGAGTIRFWTTINEPPQLTAPEWTVLLDLVHDNPGLLLVIDTLGSSAADADITSNKDLSKIMARIKQLRDAGATIVLLHHTPKNDDRKYVGASVIFNQVDHVIAMYPVVAPGSEKASDDDASGVYRLGTVDKTRFGHYHTFVEFDEDALIFKPAKDPESEVFEEVVRFLNGVGSANQQKILDRCKTLAPQNKLRRILKRGENRYWLVTQGPHNTKTYSVMPEYVRLGGLAQ